MMKVVVTSCFACSPEKFWALLIQNATLKFICDPLVRFAPEDSPEFPERWKHRSKMRCRCFLFGIFPTGIRNFYFETVDPGKMLVQTRESDPLIRRWDHMMSVKRSEKGGTRYQDEVEIDAGLLTLFVWCWATWFYRYRHKRWARLLAQAV